MFDMSHQIEDVALLLENDLVIYNSTNSTQDYVSAVGILIRKINDAEEDTRALLIRTTQGEDITVEEAHFVCGIRPDSASEFVRMFMLSYFMRIKAAEVGGPIELKVCVEAHSSAREVAVAFRARCDYGNFVEAPSMDRTVSKLIARATEDKLDEVKALPAY